MAELHKMPDERFFVGKDYPIYDGNKFSGLWVKATVERGILRWTISKDALSKRIAYRGIEGLQ